MHGWLQVGEFTALDVISMKGMKAYVCSLISFRRRKGILENIKKGHGEGLPTVFRNPGT